MEDQEISLHIASISALEELPKALRKQVADVLIAVSKHVKVSAETVLFKRGDDQSSNGIVLLSGSVRVDPETGKSLSVSAPELLGEMQQFDVTSRRLATVTAETDCDVLLFEWHDLVHHAMQRFTRNEQVAVREALRHVAGERLQQLAGLGAKTSADSDS